MVGLAAALVRQVSACRGLHSLVAGELCLPILISVVQGLVYRVQAAVSDLLVHRLWEFVVDHLAQTHRRMISWVHLVF